MSTLSSLYGDHHKRCDDAFADAEAAAAEGRWPDAAAATTRFARMLGSHLDSEEGTLFPAFEQATGMRGGGPTFVMRAEHEQMRGLLAELSAAVTAKAKDDFAGAAETLLVLMQQHNLKEENILYPLCDRALGDGALATTVQSQLAS